MNHGVNYQLVNVTGTLQIEHPKDRDKDNLKLRMNYFQSGLTNAGEDTESVAELSDSKLMVPLEFFNKKDLYRNRA
jgi:nitroimidazol reductase NimA-like FMN-containing flavoprotein (pyridoxamine 5'-phosphate oxidase superfamily)